MEVSGRTGNYTCQICNDWSSQDGYYEMESEDSRDETSDLKKLQQHEKLAFVNLDLWQTHVTHSQHTTEAATMTDRCYTTQRPVCNICQRENCYKAGLMDISEDMEDIEMIHSEYNQIDSVKQENPKSEDMEDLSFRQTSPPPQYPISIDASTQTESINSEVKPVPPVETKTFDMISVPMRCWTCKVEHPNGEKLQPVFECFSCQEIKLAGASYSHQLMTRIKNPETADFGVQVQTCCPYKTYLGPVKCMFCGESFESTAGLEEYPVQPAYECRRCIEQNASQLPKFSYYSLEYPKSPKVEKEDLKFRCNTCEREFEKERGLKIHIGIKHKATRRSC